MNKEEKKIYRALQEHLDKMIIGFPSTESGIELRVLKHLFTIEEAKIAINLKFIPQTLKQIYRKVRKDGVSIEELEQKLNTMFMNGTILLRMEENNTFYMNSPLIVGMWEAQLGRLHPDLIRDVRAYLSEAYFNESYNKTSIPQLRTIPVEYSIDHEQKIATYDNVREIIDNSDGPIAVMDCLCRKSNDILGDPCKQTDLRETCFTFMKAAEVFQQKNLARFIDKKEAYEILKKAEKDGLILQPTNSQNPVGLCCCCGCCCDILQNQKKFNSPARLFATNFYAEVIPDLCKGYETCIEICQMGAIKTNQNKAIINKDYCIGCGNCVIKCPQNAIQLKKKKDDIMPPLNTQEAYLTMMKNKAELNRIV